MKNVDFNKKYINYNKVEVEQYLSDLRLVGSLSGLFADGDIPLLHYRATEKLYCVDFGATNLARADVSADAKLKSKGIGIKTFIEANKKTLQKVAEFNSQQVLYKDLSALEKVKKIAELRNNRLIFTLSAYALTDLVYHCIVRNKKGFYLYEEKMDFIDIDKIKLTGEAQHTLMFTDGKAEYKFDGSKSTLYKRFVTDEYFAFVKVDILTDPLEVLRRITLGKDEEVVALPEKDKGASTITLPEILSQEITFAETIIVPLYSYKNGKKIVFPKSGLNQWNANGRPRDYDEVYIPFNSVLRGEYENFFPLRDTPFEVELPNGEIMSMKICQDNSKAIMSNPNKALGKWLLRDVLKLKQGEIVTYDMLLALGIDAVSFQKYDNGKYRLDFKQVGEFEKFMDKEVLTDYE